MNLILGMIEGYKEEDLSPFIKSLQASNFQGDVVFFVNRISKETKSYLKNNNIKAIQVYSLYPHYAILSKYSHNLLFKTLINLILFINSKLNIKIPFRDTLCKMFWHCQAARYFHYKHFLKNTKKKYDSILITDVRDVIFQDDPFHWQMDSSIASFEEYPEIKINQQVYNKIWLQACYGTNVLEQLGDKKIICSGVTFGTYKGITQYLDKMSEHLSRCFASVGYDQAIHNYLFYNQMLKDISIIPQGQQVLHLALNPLDSITFNHAGKIINHKNMPYCIVHQYDRHPEIKQRLLASNFR